MGYKCSECGDERYVQGNLVNMTVDNRGIWAWTMCRCYNCAKEFVEGRLFEYLGKGCQISVEEYQEVLKGRRVE